MPDCVLETFEPKTDWGGEDGADGRALRFMEWSDRGSEGQVYEELFAIVLREPSGEVRVELDRHRFGVFPRAAWLEWMDAAGLPATSRMDPWKRDIFVGKRAAAGSGPA